MYALFPRWLLAGLVAAFLAPSLKAADPKYLVVHVWNGYSTNVYARMQLDGAGYDNVRLVPAGGSAGWTNNTGFHWSGTRTVTVKWGPSSSLNNLYFTDPSAGYSGIVNGESYSLNFTVGPPPPAPPPNHQTTVSNLTGGVLTIWKTENGEKIPIVLGPGEVLHVNTTNGFSLDTEEYFWAGDWGGWVTNKNNLGSWDPSSGSSTNTGGVNSTASPSNPNNQPVFNAPSTDDQKSANAIVSAIQQHEQSNTRGQLAIKSAVDGVRDGISGLVPFLEDWSTNTQALEIGILNTNLQRIAEAAEATATNVFQAHKDSTNYSENLPESWMEQFFDADLREGLKTAVKGQVSELDEAATELEAGAEGLSEQVFNGTPGIWDWNVGGVAVSVDPLANPEILAAFTFSKTVIKWALLVGFVASALAILAASVIPVGQSQANTSPNAAQITAEAGAALASRGASLLVTGGVRVAFSVAAMAAVAFVPVLLFLKLTSKWSLAAMWTSSPFAVSGPVMTEAMRLIDAAFPLGFAVSGVVFLLSFRLVCLITAWVGFAVVKSTK